MAGNVEASAGTGDVDTFDSFFASVRAGKAAAVRAALARGVDPVALERDHAHLHRPLVVAAVRSGNVEVITLLLNAGLSPNANANERSESPLRIAAKMGNYAAVDALLSHGAHPDGTGAGDRSPLCAALDAWLQADDGFDGDDGDEWEDGGDEYEGESDEGSDDDEWEDVSDDDGESFEGGSDDSGEDDSYSDSSSGTDASEEESESDGPSEDDEPSDPRVREARDAYARIALRLVQAGANVSAPLVGYGTPLCLVAMTSLADLVHPMVSRGASVAPEHSKQPLHTALKFGQLGTARALLECRASVHARDGQGHTPMCYACEHRRPQFAELLLEWGADPKAACGVDDTPLHCACITAAVDVVRMLLARGARLDTRDDEGRLPLHCACEGGSLPVIELLVEKGADVNAVVTDTGRTVLHLACLFASVEAVKFLVEHGADMSLHSNNGSTALHCACRKGVAAFLIERGADVNAATQEGHTPLMHACEMASVATVQLLLEHGASVNARMVDSDMTALHFACEAESSSRALRIGKLLIDAGADLEARTMGECTPLLLACANGHYALAELLVTRGAKADARDDAGNTALHLLSDDYLRKRHGESADPFGSLVRELIARGASLSSRNTEGQTALDAALDHGFVDTAIALVHAGAALFKRDKKRGKLSSPWMRVREDYESEDALCVSAAAAERAALAFA